MDLEQGKGYVSPHSAPPPPLCIGEMELLEYVEIGTVKVFRDGVIVALKIFKAFLSFILKIFTQVLYLHYFYPSPLPLQFFPWTSHFFSNTLHDRLFFNYFIVLHTHLSI